MELAHDLGGRRGFGPVEVEPDEPPFHEPWERSARALVYAAVMTTSNPSTSLFRWSIEPMDRPYWESWTAALEELLRQTGLLPAADLAALPG